MSKQAKTILINLISCEGANVGKALRIGRKFLAADWEVVLLINLDAVKLLAPTFSRDCPVAGKPLKDLLQAFQTNGGRTLVGTECLALAKLAESDLLPGMEMAKFPLVEEILSRPNTRTMTW